MAGSKGSKYYDIFLDYSINLEHKSNGNIINPYKFELLKAIHETGSLKMAAVETGVSYRKAWGSIDETEKSIGFKLVNRQRGGAEGGKTSLTADGISLIRAHEELTTDFNQAVSKITKKFFQTLNQ